MVGATTGRKPVQKPVQKFKPTSGRAVGVLGIVVMLVLLVYVAATEHDLLAVRVCLALAIGALVIWMTMLRPRAEAYDDTLVLHNMASSTRLPMTRIDAVVVRHMLNVWIADARYVCVGIGRSSRSMINRRTPGPAAVLGFDASEDRMRQGQSSKIGAGTEYANFVENRIEGLARAARRDALGTPPVRRVWALPELVALAGLLVAFVVSLLV